ncbi:MAG: LCP family protein [Acutalibacteraceae bacterium]
MNGRKKDRRSYLKYAAAALLLIMFVSIALLLLNLWEKRQGSFPIQEVDGSLRETVELYGQSYVLNEDIETVLVMGLDKFDGDIDNTSYNNDQQADFLMLFVFDNKNKECTALQINRDTMTEINILGVAGQKIDTETKQIALSHTYGNGKQVSCRNTADAVSGLLYGVKIDRYLSVTMDAVPVFNDMVSGVTVEVLDDFTGIDDTLVKGETVTLMGEQALRYVRTRYGMEDSTNEHRMKRQQQYIRGLYEKTKETVSQDESFIAEATLRLSDYMVSNCTVNQLETLFGKISSYKFNGISNIEGESQKGEEFIEFYPDEESLKKLVVELFYKPEE